MESPVPLGKLSAPQAPSEQQERQTLAQLHKRIREEKQRSGRVISVGEAKQLLNDEQQPAKKPATIRRTSAE